MILWDTSPKSVSIEKSFGLSRIGHVQDNKRSALFRRQGKGHHQPVN
jgi:hypothetical protein